MNDKMITRDAGKERLDYIDGIRAIAAIFVYLCHISCVFLPGLYNYELSNSWFEKLWIGLPLNIITNGNAAVKCFFVLSGFLITRKIYLSSKGRMSSPFNIYFKFLRIILPAVLFSAFLMVAGQMYHIRAFEANTTLAFVSDYNNFRVSIVDMIGDAFVRTFLNNSSYVGPFWTITHEFVGSIFITIISFFIFNKMKYRKLCYLFFALFAYLKMPHFFPFVMGAIAYDCIYSENEDTVCGRIIRYLASHPIVLSIVFALGIYFFSVNDTVSSIWNPISLIPFIGKNKVVLRSVGFSVCLFCINELNCMKKALSCRPLKFLGKISAYIYAFHWPVLLSLGCGIYLLLQNIPYYLAVAVVSIVVLAATILLSYLYTMLLPFIMHAENKVFASFSKKIELIKSKTLDKSKHI